MAELEDILTELVANAQTKPHWDSAEKANIKKVAEQITEQQRERVEKLLKDALSSISGLRQEAHSNNESYIDVCFGKCGCITCRIKTALKELEAPDA